MSIKKTPKQNDLPEKLQEAINLHQQGLLAQAAEKYRAILVLDPHHFDAMHLLGVVTFQSGDAAGAVELFDQAISYYATHPTVYMNRGIALQSLNRFEEALVSYQKALALKPDYLDVSVNCGAVLQSLKRFDEALICFEKVLAVNPNHVNALCNRANVLQDLKRFEDAHADYERALAIEPNRVEILSNNGNALQGLGRHQESLIYYQRALAIDPNFLSGWFNQGNALQAMLDFSGSIDCYRRALAIDPNYAEGFFNAAKSFFELGQIDDALVYLDRVLAIMPNHLEALSNRGVALLKIHDYQRAVSTLEQVLSINPKHVQALMSHGFSMLQLRHIDQAIADFAKVSIIDPNDFESQFNEGFCRLLMRDFKEGLRQYEYRWEVKNLGLVKPDLPCPEWTGEQSLQGKTLLVYEEQGLGDIMQFCRYTQKIVDLGGRVIITAPKSLQGILQSMPSISKVFLAGEVISGFDYACPLLSLPYLLGEEFATIYAPSKYLSSDPTIVDIWKNKIAHLKSPKIGVVWSGNPAYGNDQKRSIALEKFSKICVAGAQYISLQKECRDEDKLVLTDHPNIHFMGDDINDFSDTAAIIELMDLVITVDTSVAHLAGALGKQVWILIPFNSDWRWFIDGDVTPWYPSARLFRQDILGNWDHIIGRVQSELCVVLDKNDKF